MDTLELINKSKVIAIVRKVYGSDLDKLSKALCDGGVKLIECTFDQIDPDCSKKTAQAISMLCHERGNDMRIGAGTVLSPEQVDVAYNAGAKFIISPNVNPAVIKRTKELGMISIPGAMTPSEILTAHDLGADLVKLFPAGTLGMKYIKDILAPITHVKLVATGGVTEDNFADFLALGMTGAGVSGRLTDKKLISEGNWAELSRRAAAFAEIAGR
ncbi:bifunctional 4-hydroxy-2-oxoglutarate aldolase/2-dehydro-3-deoxy-phosphogluconate aldolase [Dysosmobacter sp.]|uniref:bifunctional 4-hydroxy-2-oxoglutarate aldolase/2-dehydro-3-deoxy-phosphogluconate aldolase n=1 Tax=Dysosmobacter sp. TaxID=2591382 RepID=UPI003AB44ABC